MMLQAVLLMDASMVRVDVLGRRRGFVRGRDKRGKGPAREPAYQLRLSFPRFLYKNSRPAGNLPNHQTHRDESNVMGMDPARCRVVARVRPRVADRDRKRATRA